MYAGSKSGTYGKEGTRYLYVGESTIIMNAMMYMHMVMAKAWKQFKERVQSKMLVLNEGGERQTTTNNDSHSFRTFARKHKT